MVYPIIYCVSTIEGGSGFLPPTIAIEHGPFIDFTLSAFFLNGHFHSSVSLPEGILSFHRCSKHQTYLGLSFIYDGWLMISSGVILPLILIGDYHDP